MKEFVSYIKGNKKALVIMLAGCIGILLMIFSGAVGGGAEKVETLDEYKAGLEKEIESLCSDIEGVGKCRVYITIERGEQSIYKGSSVIETKPPRVLGVTVVCRGADSVGVRGELTEMLCSLFAIGSNRVAILKLNS